MNKLLKKAIIAFVFLILIVGSVYLFVVPPKVISITPIDNLANVPLNSSFKLEFDKPVRRKIVQHIISPNVYGEWKFEDPLIKNHLFRTLVFSPVVSYKPGTLYHVEIKNITSPLSFSLSRSFSFDFKTQNLSNILMRGTDLKSSTSELDSDHSQAITQKPRVVLLDIPLDWQDYRLSCEAASLKMALSYKGIHVSEDEIMKEIGYDSTFHRDGTWGDPYKGFVGNINGKICTTGYGVYWPAVAKAANKWREAEAFSGWKLTDLTREIALGNPVIFWGTLPVKEIHDCSWHTPEGKYIKAVREDHVRVVVGFIGNVDNPLKIIINDPLAGRLYWSPSYFLTNWKVFGYSGVVVR